MVKEEITNVVRKHFKINENWNTIGRNLQDAAKGVLIGKLIAVNTYTKKKRPQVNTLTFHLKKLEKKSKANSKQLEEKKYRLES